jgi:hypothetical protein
MTNSLYIAHRTSLSHANLVPLLIILHSSNIHVISIYVFYHQRQSNQMHSIPKSVTKKSSISRKNKTRTLKFWTNYLVEVSGAGAGGATGGIADADWNVLEDPPELDLQVLLFLLEYRRRVLDKRLRASRRLRLVNQLKLLGPPHRHVRRPKKNPN